MLRRQPCSVGRRFRRTVVTFLLISHNPNVDVETEYIAKKPTNRAFQDTFAKRYFAYKSETFHRRRPSSISHCENGEQKPPNLPFLLHDVDPHVIQQCLGPPHAPPQTAAPTVEALSHTYAVKSPLITMTRPKFAPKSTPFRGPIPTTCLIPGPVRPMMSNRSRIRSAVFGQCTGQIYRRTDRPTDRQTDR